MDLDDGLLYLGFTLKSKIYSKKDWSWILTKIEKTLSIWCNKWLSMGGRLILVKYALEAIPVYWVSLTYVPSGILERIGRL